MGLANLVPGISGGTMLLAVGVYPQFIGAVAEVSTFRLRPRTVLFLATVVVAALVAVVAGAGPVSRLVIDHRWIMYSLFIGLTLGGVPLLYRLLKPIDGPVVVATVLGIAAMAVLATIDPGGAAQTAGAQRASALLVIAGIAGGSAMILPGVSGGYLLLLLGQYVAVLTAIDRARGGVAGSAWNEVGAAMQVLVPFGVGVLIGIVGVANLLKILLARWERPTLGVLLGLLLGAVIGLWPFRRAEAPLPGQIIKGRTLLDEQMAAAVDPADWPEVFFTPSAGHVAIAVLLLALGFAFSAAVARLGTDRDREPVAQD
jgi:putative membrane protein